LKLELDKWIIMDKKRRVIAKGVPRDRHLISVDDIGDKKRVLYYDTEGKARSGFTSSGFYNNYDPDKSYINENGFTRYEKYDLEPVHVKITIEEINN